jgi:hypothetical protein
VEINFFSCEPVSGRRGLQRNVRFCRIEGVGCGHGVVVGVTRPMLRGVWRGGELHENGGALDDVEPAKLEEAKNLSFCGRIRRPVGGPPGPPPSPYAARHCFGRSLSVHSGRHKAKVRRVPTPCHSQRIAHWGPCGKTRVVLQNLRPKPEPADIRDSRRRCALVEVWVSRDVEPPVGLAVRLRALGAEVRGCAPLDGAEQLAEMQP